MAIRTKQKRIVQRKSADKKMNVSLGLRGLSANHDMREKTDQNQHQDGTLVVRIRKD